MSVQVEETTREREERLKGWSTFLEGGEQQQENNKPAENSTATEPSKPSGTTEPEQRPAAELQSSQEQEVDSTDSSLAGSDEEEA